MSAYQDRPGSDLHGTQGVQGVQAVQVYGAHSLSDLAAGQPSVFNGDPCKAL